MTGSQLEQQIEAVSSSVQQALAESGELANLMADSELKELVNTEVKSMVTQELNTSETQKTNLEEKPGSAKKHAVSTFFPNADSPSQKDLVVVFLFVFNYNSAALR